MGYLCVGALSAPGFFIHPIWPLCVSGISGSASVAASGTNPLGTTHRSSFMNNHTIRLQKDLVSQIPSRTAATLR